MTAGTSLMVATPSHRGDGRECIGWAARMADEAMVATVASVVTSCPWIDVARARLMSTFLASTCSHVLFRDDDIDVSGATVARMLALGEGCVVVPYRLRVPPYGWVTRHVTPPGGGRPRAYPGLGCTLLSRHVLERMVTLHPELGFDLGGRAMHALFQPFIRDRWLLNEDDAFFDRLQSAGFGVTMMLGEQATHAGVKSFPDQREADATIPLLSTQVTS